MGKLRKTLAIPIAAALLACAVLFFLPGYTGVPGRSTHDPRAAPGRVGLELSLPLPRSSDVDRLREKTRGGTDRFLVEGIHEELEPRLDSLEAFLRDPLHPGAGEILAKLLAPGFTSSGLVPGKETVLRDRQGITAHALQYAGGSVGAAELPAEAARFIRPLARLDLASFKVIGVEAKGDAAHVRAIHELGGEAEGGLRIQWRGNCELSFTRSGGDWMLARFTVLDAVRSTLDGMPFRDVTRSSLAGSPHLESVLLRSIDDFRDRMDAAFGIDVYGHHGVAAGDADGDGIDDIYVAMPPSIPNLLYRGLGNGRFEEIGARGGADVLDGTSHPLFIDLENDGDEDLFLVTDAGILLLENDGKGRFRRTPSGAGAIGTARSTPMAAAAADYDLDGWVDVYVACYVFWRGAVGELGTRLPFPYHEARNGAPSFLLRNRGPAAADGKGRFEDVTARAGLDRNNTRFSFAASWGDADGDGDPDLFVANDFGSKNLYRNEGNGAFTETTREAGVEDVGAGMSAAWEDYDSDGDLDLYVGNMFSSAGRRVTGTEDYRDGNPEIQKLYRRHARGNSLFRNRGNGTFDEVTEESRVEFGRWAWASGFIDFDLDGREDIYVQNGFITNQRSHDL